MKPAVALVLSLLVAFAAAAIGGVATQRAPEFYLALTRPTWAPPSWLFGPVWTLLYTLMAVAAWLVWRERTRRSTRGPLALYAVQLAFNALWSWLFFAWQRGTLAEVEILLLVGLIAATLVAFWRVRPLAGMMLLPYLAWASYAAALTFALVRANQGVL